MNQHASRNLAHDIEGATLTEFALILPALMALLMGVFDVSYNMYATAILEGAMQEAGRDSTVEGAATTAADNAVTAQVRNAVPSATIVFTRKAYADFSDIAQAEEFNDLNGDGICNDGEPFEDFNANGSYDLDRGITGQGNSKQAVVLTATMSFDRLFPVASLIGLPNTFTTASSTVLRNQPYDINDSPPPTENCA